MNEPDIGQWTSRTSFLRLSLTIGCLHKSLLICPLLVSHIVGHQNLSPQQSDPFSIFLGSPPPLRHTHNISSNQTLSCNQVR